MRKLFVLAALLVSAMAWAQQYRWIDPADGRVRYGDTPPPGVKATRMGSPASGPASAPSAAPQKGAAKKDEKPLTPEQAFQKRQQEQKEQEAKAAKGDQIAAEKRANCDAARAQLTTAESGQRMARTDAKGERYFLDESQLAAELAKARQAVQQWCN